MAAGIIIAEQLKRAHRVDVRKAQAALTRAEKWHDDPGAQVSFLEAAEVLDEVQRLSDELAAQIITERYLEPDSE